MSTKKGLVEFGKKDIDLQEVYFRGPKSLNFPDGNFQRAKTFRAECVNRFRDKKKRVNRFRDKKTCVNSFCDKKGALIVFATKKSVCKSSLQQNKCAQIIFATKKCA